MRSSTLATSGGRPSLIICSDIGKKSSCTGKTIPPSGIVDGCGAYVPVGLAPRRTARKPSIILWRSGSENSLIPQMRASSGSV